MGPARPLSGGGRPDQLARNSRGTDGKDLLVYPKPDHVPANFTVLNLSVPDIAEAVDELAARGIIFQRYPEYEQDRRGIYHGEGHSIAWFTDPAGNVLSVIEE